MCGRLPILNLINKTTHHHHDPCDYKNEHADDNEYVDGIFDYHNNDSLMKVILLCKCKEGHLINMSGKCKEEKIRWDEPS